MDRHSNNKPTTSAPTEAHPIPTYTEPQRETITLNELRMRVANLEGLVEQAEGEVNLLRRQSQQFRLQISVELMRIANNLTA